MYLGSEEDDEPEPSTEPPRPSITNLSRVLEDRLKMYEAAETNAKAAGESVRARRFARGLKTIKDLLKQANAGKSINEEDIPPEVTANIQKHEPEPQPLPKPPDSEPLEPPADPPQPDPEIPLTPQSPELGPEKVELLSVLNGRKNEYKMAALAAKKSGDQATAIAYIKIAKQFDAVVAAVEAGQPVDLSGMPGPPTVSRAAPQPAPPIVEHNEVQKQSDEKPEIETELPEQGKFLIFIFFEF